VRETAAELGATAIDCTHWANGGAGTEELAHHVVSVREVGLSAGAGFLVFVCGDIMTMPGLPRVPAADKIHIDDAGLIQGLF
jgi:formyltetrahydrofolate synthetase